ncbi:HAD-IA family hydrolase [Stutzerimonas urumqiensis]|uniref:HAD-IA family hydrolase n=1 Tax=Stutzerimonas urumqiensis TaxID=638269 RepID=UPI000EADB497|nr:HAD-IA family hydrolase [Stutzerimonas urumqiensis]
MLKYDLLIFDWDGTLVDSIERIVVCMREAARGCGLPQRDDSQIKGIIGLGLPDAIAVLYPEVAGTGVADDFRRRYSDCYLGYEGQPSPLFPGVAHSLQRLRAAGYRLAVATGKSRRGLDRALRDHGWDGYFDITRCADETASKPDPLMLREILAYCDVCPERALMIGDSLFDLQMAARAGMDAVAVAYGAQSMACLQTADPLLTVECFDEFAAWLAAFESCGVDEYVG